MANGNWWVQHAALKLFEASAKQGQVFIDAIAAASAGMVNTFSRVQEVALKLFTALFKKDQGFSAETTVRNAVIKGMASCHWGTRIAASNLKQAFELVSLRRGLPN